jgi:hypothetical protein
MGAKKQNKSRRKVKVAKRRKARRPKFKVDVVEAARTANLIRAVLIFASCGVDLFATGQHSDPRMNFTLADIKQQYPWLAEISKVFR